MNILEIYTKQLGYTSVPFVHLFEATATNSISVYSIFHICCLIHQQPAFPFHSNSTAFKNSQSTPTDPVENQEGGAMYISCGDDGVAVEAEMGYVPNNPLFGLPLDSPQVIFVPDYSSL